MSQSSYYRWKSKYGGLEVNEAVRLKAFEEETMISTRSLSGDFLPATLAFLRYLIGFSAGVHLDLNLHGIDSPQRG